MIPQIGPVDLVELGERRIDMLADLERFEQRTLLDNVLQTVALELATLVQLETLELVATHAGELLQHRVRVVDVVEEETLHAAERVHTRRDHARIHALEPEHAQRVRVQLEQRAYEFDDFHFDQIVRCGRVGRVGDLATVSSR